MIFKDIRQGRPYPEHGLSTKDWAQIPPQQVNLAELVTTATVVELDRLLSEDPTLPGDLFPHAVRWCGELFLEDGLHRAMRAALHQRTVLPVRILNLDLLRH
ncbi:MAG TPA: type II toxin-antitoxin system VapB family antitoxin [Pseudonocardiaceae bacterium]|nr:type II toxin-antitoxin system VapB family antitoxin [Pseudonocardiaceae bacterium]